MSKPFWKFVVNAATANEPESVELRIDGEIMDDGWVWFYEYFNIPVAAPNKFRNELAKHAGKNLIVRIDSPGGSVFAGMGIYDALMDHKRTGAHITAIGGPQLMSAALLPYMAGDKKMVTLGGMVMVHNPLGAMDGYGYAKDFRQIADILDEVKEAIVNVYEHGTGLEREKIVDLMEKETHMSARAAVSEGFADEIYQPVSKNKKAEPKNIMDGFMFSRLVIQNSAKASMDKLIELVKTEETDGQLEMSLDVKPVEFKNQKKEDRSMEIKTVDDLRNAYPQLVEQVEAEAKNAGAQEERERIRAIEEIAKNIDPALVKKAKFEEPKDAKELAFEALKADQMKAQNYLQEVKDDSKNSGVDDVGAVPVDGQGGEEKPKNLDDKFKSVAAKLDARRRGV